MECKKAIYKKREVDLTATMDQLAVSEQVFLPSTIIRSSEQVRAAASRMPSGKFKVNAIDGGLLITRAE